MRIRIQICWCMSVIRATTPSSFNLGLVWYVHSVPHTHVAVLVLLLVLCALGRTPADDYLPVAHTCFFSLELPPYSSQEIMRTKLLYAVYNCQVTCHTVCTINQCVD